jgi:hypothetical protein
MARFPFFLVAAFLTIVGLIGVALLPLKSQPIVAVEARVDNGALILDGKALSQIRAARGFPVTPAPGPRGDQVGPRLASASALAPNAEFSKGARLELGPQTLAALSGRAFVVTISARGLPNNTSENMGFGVVTGGPIAWKSNPIKPTFSAVQFEVPATAQPISGLAFWAATEGQGRGIEIQSIALQPLLQNGITP